ncbi:MAG: PAS domain S-box protein [Chloroflexota bacterium]
MAQSSDQKNSSLPLDEIYGDIQRITNIFYWFIALILLGLIAGIFIVLSTHNILAAIVIAISILPVLASFYFIRRQRFEFAAAFLAFVLITAITITATNGLGIHHISVLGYPVILIVASLVIRKRLMVILTLYNILCAAWLVFGELLGAYTPTILVKSVVGDFFSVSIILILTAAMIRLVSETLVQNSLESQKELRERKLAEEKYRNLFENAIDGIFQSTLDGRFVSVNPAMARMYGYNSPEDMINSVTDISKQLYVDPQLRISLRQRVADGEQIKYFESLDYRKDGSTFWTSMNIQGICDKQDTLLFYEGTVEDITPRRIAEQERQRAEEALIQFRKLMDESNDAIFLINPENSRYIDFNRIAYEQLGYTRAELNQLGVINVATHVSSLEGWHQRMELVHENGGLIFETNYKRKDGTTFPVEVSARMLEYGGKLILVAFARNITERKRAEHERERLINELAAKNTELEQFTYTVSHDLKAPIITIKGFLGFLEKDVFEGKQEHIHKDVMRIDEAVDKMHRLLSELLELSRVGRMMNAPETIPFQDLVDAALENIHGRLEPLGITVLTQPNLPAVHGDRQRLTEVLQNLLDNAAKYMGDHSDPRIEIGQYGEDNGKPIFFVRDNGIGIAPEYHERIFGLFNQLDPKAEGTGIGLALVKRIVEVHGGRVWVESAEGEGATFYFTLPTHQT